MARHLALSIEEFGPRHGVHTMRRHLIWYARGRAGAHEFRRRVVRLEDPDEVLRRDRTVSRRAATPSARRAETKRPRGESPGPWRRQSVRGMGASSGVKKSTSHERTTSSFCGYSCGGKTRTTGSP